MNSLIEKLEVRLGQIIKEDGYQEMADGFNQALEIVRSDSTQPADCGQKMNRRQFIVAGWNIIKGLWSGRTGDECYDIRTSRYQSMGG